MSLPFASRSGCRSAAIVAAILLALAFSTAEQAFAQTGAWTAHTSMRQATSLDVSDGGLWVGTTGGVFRYDVATGEIRRFTIADGLHGIQVRAVAYDANCTDDRACVWIGYQDGVLDRLDPASGAVTSYRDIERARRPLGRALPPERRPALRVARRAGRGRVAPVPAHMHRPGRG